MNKVGLFDLSLYALIPPINFQFEFDLNRKSAAPIKMVTPIVGELVNLKDENQKFENWWEGLK